MNDDDNFKRKAEAPPFIGDEKEEEDKNNKKKKCRETTIAAAPEENKTGYDYVLLLEWNGDDPEDFSVLVDSVKDGLDGTAAAETNKKGEWGERSYTLKLVDGSNKEKEKNHQKQQHMHVLAELDFKWWADSCNNGTTLRDFNEMSQDLADFCESLWWAAGRNKNNYNSFHIEFGSSPYCRVQINELIAEAVARALVEAELEPEDISPIEKDTRDISSQVVYIESVKAVENLQHGERLLRGLLSLLDGRSTIVAYRSDLDKIQIDDGKRFELGFEEPQRLDGWCIRPVFTSDRDDCKNWNRECWQNLI